MRKRIVELGRTRLPRESDAGWLNLSEIATVEVTSRPSKQVIRIIFDEPVAVGRIRLRFDDAESERTQEFTLSWCPAAGGSREIVRQQWNFNRGAVTEIEDRTLDTTRYQQQ